MGYSSLISKIEIKDLDILLVFTIVDISFSFKLFEVILLVLSLLIGTVCAASLNEVHIDKNYKNHYKSDYRSVNAKNNQKSGILDS